ncbi:hypothetical protein LTR10_015978 [Elasticomyces elasticus]|nr:hypothetical protein LTR10_015978 [Elasticomyces elasticus]
MSRHSDVYAATPRTGDELFGNIPETNRPMNDWLFGSTNLFDLGNNMDFMLSDPDIDFLASIPQVTLSVEAHALPSPAPSLVSRLGQSTSQAVVDAFRQSVGRWSPERQNHRIAAESSLTLESARMDCLGKFDPKVFDKSLSTSIRDQILGVIIKSCEPDNMIQVMSAFPGLDVLDRLLKVFFSWHVTQTESWIHVPTFELKEVRIELLTACIASAAVMSSSRSVQKFGMAIQEFLVFHLWQASEKKNTLIRDLQFLQAFTLHLQIGTWSGIRRKMEMCSSFMNILTNSMRGGDRYRYGSYTSPIPCPRDEGEVLETKWKQWVEEESFKRLVYCVFVHCSQESLMTSGTSLIAYSELSLPLPQTRKLWFASSASEWKSIFWEMQAIETGRSPSLVNLLANPTDVGNLPGLYDRGLAQIVLIYASCSVIRRYRQDKAVFSSNDNIENRENILSDEAQHRSILRLLDANRGIRESGDLTSTAALDMILEVLSMHLFAPFEQMELVAGKEGPEESRLAYPSLLQWIHTSSARQAVWHAGQVLRAMRKVPSSELTIFHAVIAYHATLCIWVYGVVSQDPGDKSPSTQTLNVSDQNKVLIDGEESIQSQRWISHNRGVPLIMGNVENEATSVCWNHLPIIASEELINMSLLIVTEKFSWKNSVLVENIGHLLRALGKISRRSNKESSYKATDTI